MHVRFSHAITAPHREGNGRLVKGGKQGEQGSIPFVRFDKGRKRV
jgi:hypothetical protein